jgi:hypothetical protein
VAPELDPGHDDPEREARAELRCGSRVARRVRAATQQQQASAVVRDAQAGLKAIGESCIQRMQSDHDLDPIRGKIELSRSVISGAPPPAMLADQSRPSPQEKAAIAKWEALREVCVQEETQYGSSLSVPPNLEPRRDKLLLAVRQSNERTGCSLLHCMTGGSLTGNSPRRG